MIKKVLVANRGEIAVRVIRACKDLGIESVAVYSEADQDALHTRLADEAYCIGPAPSNDSYLNMMNVVSIAKLTEADAVHPGYGFLSENADFAELCEQCNVTFIGPSADAISRMGMKDEARKTMKEAGVPIVPGSDGVISDTDEAVRVAEEIGYPVLIKATAGGGGKGIRVARTKDDLINGIQMTQQEAAKAFGNDGVYLEKCIEDFRHVEIQVMADNHGNAIHLGERDCSIQRRLQKLVEESPSPELDEDKRQEMGEAAVRAAKAVNYSGAGTLEFIYDRQGSFYFMEMNTRIQVEHPVTEWVTGVDLVKEQILVADHQPLSYNQEDITFSGWAVECRINAENPDKNFLPSPGTLDMYLPPGGLGVRVDSAAYPGYKIPPFYDSMIAKVITYGRDRTEAIARMKRALDEFDVEGVHTTIPFHMKVLEHDKFVEGDFNTDFLKEHPINTKE